MVAYLFYMQRAIVQFYHEVLVGAQRTHDLAKDLFLQTQCLKLSGQSTGLALCPGGGIGRHSGLRSRGESLRVRVPPWARVEDETMVVT